MVERSDGSQPRELRVASVGRTPGLRIGKLLDDPGLQRALGLGPADVAEAKGARVDGRMASMLRVARYDSAA